MYTAVMAAGFRSLQWSYRAPTGHLTGALNLDATDVGLSSSMARMRGALNANITFPEPTVVNILGDDSRLAVFQFDGVNSIQFDVEMSVHDLAFKAASENLATVTEGEAVMIPVGTVGTIRNGLSVIFTSEAKSADPGTFNSGGFRHIWLFTTEWTDLGASLAHQTGINRRWRVTANLADVMPDGRLIKDVFPTVPGGLAAGIEFNTRHLVSASVLVGDGTETDITTPYSPLSVGSSKATVETTGFAGATVSSVDNTSPFALVLSAAPGSGKFAVGRYQFANF